MCFFRCAEKPSRSGDFFTGNARKVSPDAEAVFLCGSEIFFDKGEREKCAGEDRNFGVLGEKNKGKAWECKPFLC